MGGRLSAVVGSAVQERSGEARRPPEICYFYPQAGDRVEKWHGSSVTAAYRNARGVK
jgi:hypothetical protein